MAMHVREDIFFLALSGVFGWDTVFSVTPVFAAAEDGGAAPRQRMSHTQNLIMRETSAAPPSLPPPHTHTHSSMVVL